MCHARASCFLLLMQLVAQAFCLALASAGNSRPARMAMMAITTNNSIKVKAALLAFISRPLAVFNLLFKQFITGPERIARSGPVTTRLIVPDEQAGNTNCCRQPASWLHLTRRSQDGQPKDLSHSSLPANALPDGQATLSGRARPTAGRCAGSRRTVPRPDCQMYPPACNTCRSYGCNAHGSGQSRLHCRCRQCCTCN